VKKWMTILLVSVLLVLLTACSEEEVISGEAMKAYYISTSETKAEVRDYYMQATEAEEQLDEILRALSVVPGKLEYKAPLALGFKLLDYQLHNGLLTLNMDSNYLKLKATTEILVRYALVSTLTQIEGINYVKINVEDKPLYDNMGKLVGAMNVDMFVNNTGSETATYETADLLLYFTNEAGDKLIAVNRKKPYNTNISLDRLVVEQLIGGPSDTVEGVYPTISPAANALSVLTKDGTCYVNFDETFLNQISNVTADVAIYSIVNSLTELANVDKVQISINGDTSGTFREKYSFSTVFERNSELVTTVEKGK